MRNSLISSAKAPVLSAVVAASANARVFFIIFSSFDALSPAGYLRAGLMKVARQTRGQQLAQT